MFIFFVLVSYTKKKNFIISRNNAMGKPLWVTGHLAFKYYNTRAITYVFSLCLVGNTTEYIEYCTHCIYFLDPFTRDTRDWVETISSFHLAGHPYAMHW